MNSDAYLIAINIAAAFYWHIGALLIVAVVIAIGAVIAEARSTP